MLTVLLVVHAMSAASAGLITCSVTGLTSSFALGGASADPRFAQFGPTPAIVSDGRVRLLEVADGGEGTLFLDGYAPAPLMRTPGRPCTIVVTPGSTQEVHGTLLGVDALPADSHVWVQGCGNSAVVRDGRFLMAARPGRCTLVARAYDWQHSWTVNLPSFDVPPEGMAEVEGAFHAPNAGIGVQFDPRTLTILAFAADSAAKAAGLRVGDRLVGVDAETVARDRRELIARLAGAPGSEVTLWLADGRSVVVVRRALNDAFVADGDDLVVAEVAGPALRLAVQVGDVVVEFAGIDAEELSEGRFVGTSRGSGRVTLVVARGDDTLEFDLPRETLRVK